MNKVTLEEFDKAINELPKTNDMVSTFSSVSVKELRKTIERFEYVPSFDDLLKENKRLNNIINRMEEDLKEMYMTFGEFNEEYTEKKIRELKEGK